MLDLIDKRGDSVVQNRPQQSGSVAEAPENGPFSDVCRSCDVVHRDQEWIGSRVEQMAGGGKDRAPVAERVRPFCAFKVRHPFQRSWLKSLSANYHGMFAGAALAMDAIRPTAPQLAARLRSAKRGPVIAVMRDQTVANRQDANIGSAHGGDSPLYARRNRELGDSDRRRDSLVDCILLHALDANAGVNLREVVAEGVATLKPARPAGRREWEFKHDVRRALIQQIVDFAAAERGQKSLKDLGGVGGSLNHLQVASFPRA